MPRKLRIQYPGAMYHVMNRGDQREAIFRDDDDRQKFLSTLGEACQKTEWQVPAYGLMRNHFHLVLETPQPNLVAGMKRLLRVYTKRYNIRHKLCGHLFAGRYKALVVERSGNGYLRTVCDYVHLNPVRAGRGAPRQGGHRPAASERDDHEPQMDCGAIGDGDVDPRIRPAARRSGSFAGPGGVALVSIVGDTCSCWRGPMESVSPSKSSCARTTHCAETVSFRRPKRLRAPCRGSNEPYPSSNTRSSSLVAKQSNAGWAA
jgi:REP element-mobilizing transposase RayT